MLLPFLEGDETAKHLLRYYPYAVYWALSGMLRSSCTLDSRSICYPPYFRTFGGDLGLYFVSTTSFDLGSIYFDVRTVFHLFNKATLLDLYTALFLFYFPG